MKRYVLVAIAAGFVTTASSLFNAVPAHAEVNVSITVPLPQLVLPAPPGLIVIPGTYVYYPPDVNAEIFFYRGNWYRPYRGGWYIANGYNGPWRAVGPRRLPPALTRVPPAYRGMPRQHERMPYPVVQNNWRSWESERHWDNHDRGRREHGYREHDRGRGHGEGRGRGHGRGQDD